MILLDDPIKTLGVFKVAVRLYKGVHTNIHVVVEDERSDEPPEENITDPEGTDESTKNTSPEPIQVSSDERQKMPLPQPFKSHLTSRQKMPLPKPFKNHPTSRQKIPLPKPFKNHQKTSRPAKDAKDTSPEAVQSEVGKRHPTRSSDELAKDAPAEDEFKNTIRAVQGSSDEPVEDTSAEAVQESSDETKKKEKTTSQEKQLK